MKTLRRILAPIYFMFWVGAMIAIPIGIVAFMLGVLAMLHDALYGKFNKDYFELTFAIFILPYNECVRFIDGKITP